MNNALSFVAVLMGSDSDLGTMQGCLDVLGKLDVPCEVHITSAHRTPEATRDYVNAAEQRGCAVFIAAAGMADAAPTGRRLDTAQQQLRDAGSQVDLLPALLNSGITR